MLAGLARTVIALVLAGAVLWLGLPVIASAAAGAAVSSAGLQASSLTVSVEARPPFKLLLLEADAVRVRSGPGTFRDATFERLEVTIDGVGLGRTPSALEGTISGVTLVDGAGGTIRVDSLDLSGPPGAPDVRIVMSAADVAAAIGHALPPGIGPAAAVALTAPDGLRIATAAGQVTARLAASEGGGLDLVIEGPGGTTIRVAVLAPGPSLPLAIHSVAVEDGALVLRGTIDPRSLGL